MWVPSYIGIPGNEKADEMANEAVTSTTSTIINKIPNKDLTYEAHKRIIKTWPDHWDSIPASNILRNIKKTVSKWAYPENASRHEQIIINRSRIGHSHITHSHLITKESPHRVTHAKLTLQWHTSFTAPNTQPHVFFSIIQGRSKKPSVNKTPAKFVIFQKNRFR